MNEVMKQHFSLCKGEEKQKIWVSWKNPADQVSFTDWLPPILKQAQFTLYHRFEVIYLSETDIPEFAWF